MLDKKKIIYISATSSDKYDGVYYKITAVVSAARQLGYNADSHFLDNKKSVFLHFKKIVSTDAKYIIVRNVGGWLMLALIPYFSMARLQGKYLIVDIPTPLRTQLKTIMNSPNSLLKRLRHLFYAYLNGPIPYWLFNKIIEYAEEGRYFLIGNKQRVVLMGNGIDAERVKLRINTKKNKGELILVGVANLNSYHGYDRVIRAISEWQSNNGKLKILFHVIGGNESATLQDLKMLAQKEGVEDNLYFHGNQDQEFISNYYSLCDIAVGTLALYRVGLSTASVLKNREYALAGLPFISTGIDVDFPDNMPFNFVISNDNTTNDLLSIFETFQEKRKLFSDQEIRDYCIKHTSFINKLHQLGF